MGNTNKYPKPYENAQLKKLVPDLLLMQRSKTELQILVDELKKKITFFTVAPDGGTAALGTSASLSIMRMRG